MLKLEAIPGIGVIKAEELRKLGVQSRADLRRPDIWAKLSPLTRAHLTWRIATNVPISIAHNIILEYKRQLVRQKFHDRIYIVGSLSRKVGYDAAADIDLLTTGALSAMKLNERSKSLEQLAFFGGRKHAMSIVRYTTPSGRSYVTILDLFHCEPSALPFALFALRATRLYNIKIRAHAKAHGFLLNDKGLWKNGRKVAGIRIDRDIYRALGKKYKPVQKRI